MTKIIMLITTMTPCFSSMPTYKNGLSAEELNLQRAIHQILQQIRANRRKPQHIRVQVLGILMKALNVMQMHHI